MVSMCEMLENAIGTQKQESSLSDKNCMIISETFQYLCNLVPPSLRTQWWGSSLPSLTVKNNNRRRCRQYHILFYSFHLKLPDGVRGLTARGKGTKIQKYSDFYNSRKFFIKEYFYFLFYPNTMFYFEESNLGIYKTRK